MNEQKADSAPDYGDLHAALVNIAQYDERWTGLRINDAPNRQQLIARAYDALFPPEHIDSSES